MAQVRVFDKDARLYFKKMFRRAEDFRPIFRWARDELERSNRQNFATSGTASGRPWSPLDTEYSRWKLANAGPKPLLVFDGTLRRSLTSLRGRPNEIDKKKAVFGTDIEYAKFHQFGTRKMPQRKIVFVPPFFAEEMAARIANYVVNGELGSRGTLLRRAF